MYPTVSEDRPRELRADTSEPTGLKGRRKRGFDRKKYGVVPDINILPEHMPLASYGGAANL
jgi:hypothetical protein